MRVAVGLVLCLMLASIPVTSAQSDSNDEDAWPGEPIDNHVHMTWAALTLEVNQWADWGECSTSCAEGTHIRKRTISQSALHGGQVCPVLSETEACTVGHN